MIHPGTVVFVTSPKGRRIRGIAIVETVNRRTKKITFRRPIPKIRKGDVLIATFTTPTGEKP